MKVDRVFSAALLAGLAMFVVDHWGRTHQRRRTARPAPLAEPLQVWEGEGGQNQMSEPADTLAPTPVH